MLESVRIVFIGLVQLFILVMPNTKHLACQFYKALLNQLVMIFDGAF